jgi:hypothetical protein
MSGKQYGFVLVLAMLTGFVGGLSAGRLDIGEPVFPESQATQTIKANAIELIDSHGGIHAALDITTDGSPGLFFYDESHNPRVILDMTDNGDPRLFLFDMEGKIRTVFGLGLGADGSPFMHLRNKNRDVIWSAP